MRPFQEHGESTFDSTDLQGWCAGDSKVTDVME